MCVVLVLWVLVVVRLLVFLLDFLGGLGEGQLTYVSWRLVLFVVFSLSGTGRGVSTSTEIKI